MFNRSRNYWKLYSKRRKQWFLSWINETLIFSFYASDSSFFDKIIIMYEQRKWRNNYKNHALTFVNFIFWWRICKFCFIDEFNAFIVRYLFIYYFLKWISAIKELFFNSIFSFFFLRWRIFNRQRWKKRDY